MILRAQDETQLRMRQAKGRDMFGFEYAEYVEFLDFEHAKEFLVGDLTAESYKYEPRSAEALSQAAKDYMGFWLEKIESERGISVCRATAHFTAWKWLLSHPDADTFPGSLNGGDGGYYQRDAYDYIKGQIDSGEWDRLTAATAKP